MVDFQLANEDGGILQHVDACNICFAIHCEWRTNRFVIT